MNALSPSQHAFVESVVALRPRIAAFDCDGTLWPLDSGEGFFYWEMERGLIPPDVATWARQRYDDYRRGAVGEETMCGEMVTIHAGLSEPIIAEAAREYFEETIAPIIFPEMQALTSRLADDGVELWAVSSTNNWVVNAGVERFGIARQRVLAACVDVDGDVVGNRLVHVPSGEAKATLLRQRLAGPLDTAFGNSIHDAAMLGMARNAFAINPSAELEDLARSKGWTVYRPSLAE
jgi:phosphoserine phosphatase